MKALSCRTKSRIMMAKFEDFNFDQLLSCLTTKCRNFVLRTKIALKLFP